MSSALSSTTGSAGFDFFGGSGRGRERQASEHSGDEGKAGKRRRILTMGVSGMEVNDAGLTV